MFSMYPVGGKQSSKHEKMTFFFLLSLRPTLYVGKLDSHLYASTSLVHHGVSLVVS